MFLSDLLEQGLLSASPDLIAEAFIWVMLFFLIMAVWGKKKNKWHGFTQYAPTLLTTVGILGTFAGIIVGLLEFDVNDIEKSIPGLLAGLQTAFITSLVGMLLSIVYKVAVASGMLSPKVSPTEDEDQISTTDFYSIMEEQADGVAAMKAAVMQQTDALELMARSIGGDHESSLMGQFKLLRSDLNDNHKEMVRMVGPMVMSVDDLVRSVKSQQEEFRAFQDRLWIKLQDFADMLSKSATETVINALKEVISDFNNNLTEQFGENFKELNAAVEKLVQWQENYKGQIADMTQQYAQGVQAISATEQSVNQISEKTATIPSAMDALKAVVEVNQHQISELDRHLHAFGDVRDRAVEAVPQIRQQIDETIAGAQSVSKEIGEGMKQAAQSVEHTLKDSAEQSARQINDSSEKLTSAISNGADKFVNGSQSVSQTLESTSELLKQRNDETNRLLRNLVDDLKQNADSMNQKLEDAGESVIRETDTIQKSFASALERMKDQIQQSAEESVRKQAEEQQKVLNGLSQHAERALSDTGDSVRKQVDALDRALEHELTQVMQAMGQSLAKISGQFTTDYSKLVIEMSRITRAHRAGANS
jgi:chromosome segregation ATPase